MTIDFEAHYASVALKVAQGRLHWGSLASLLRDRIMRLDEMIRPLPGYAPVYGHDTLVAERTALVARLANLCAEMRVA